MMLHILSQIIGSKQPSYFSAGLKSLGYLIVFRRCENIRKLFIATGLADGVYAIGMT
jgi:hypothetical protein